MVARFNILLLLAVIVSGIYLVRTSHEARGLFGELDKLQNESRRLDIDHQRLLTERQAESTNLRVEKVATAKLQMRAASSAVMQYVQDTGAK